MVTGLVINECCDVSPWAARKLAVRAARVRHHTDPGRAAVRSEEWAAIIEDRPGKLFKLTTALCLAMRPSCTACAPAACAGGRVTPRLC